ncbi:hypothetical protein L6R50_03695 [Myxococcota bacterium]|nr:hypothetical protein [Myxococcota bacterium]
MTLRNTALTIAFYPPDTCRNQSSAPLGSVTSETLLRLDCGDFLAELEGAMASEGYHVVSWQLINDTEHLTRARDLGVDLLFEINNLEIVSREESAAADTTIEFFSQVEGEPSRRLVLSDAAAVGKRCFEAYGQALTANPRDSGAMSLKVVSVHTGRSLWLFRKTVGDSDAASAVREDDFYFRPERTYDGRLGRAAAISIGSGTAFAIGGIALSDEFEGEAPLTVMQVSGGLFLGGGVALAIGDIIARAKGGFVDAEKVICLQRAVRPPWVEESHGDGKAPQDASTEGSSFSVSQRREGSDDKRAKRRAELLHAVVEAFLEDLRKLRGK